MIFRLTKLYIQHNEHLQSFQLPMLYNIIDCLNNTCPIDKEMNEGFLQLFFDDLT